MSEELKVHIHNHIDIEKSLLRKGAKLIDETYFIDTYFKQPEGKVLKIVEKASGSFINIFQAVNGKFAVVKDEQIDNAEKMKAEFTSQYGIKRILKGKRKFYKLQDYKITFNLIDDIGEFLILTGENPTKSFVEKELQIENPEYITVSFDEL